MFNTRDAQKYSRHGCHSKHYFTVFCPPVPLSRSRVNTQECAGGFKRATVKQRFCFTLCRQRYARISTTIDNHGWVGYGVARGMARGCLLLCTLLLEERNHVLMAHTRSNPQRRSHGMDWFCCTHFGFICTHFECSRQAPRSDCSSIGQSIGPAVDGLWVRSPPGAFPVCPLFHAVKTAFLAIKSSF